jgi:sugar lactone lactonase YvrE
MKIRTKKISRGFATGLLATALTAVSAFPQNPYRIATVAGTAYDRSGNNGPATEAGISGLGAAFQGGYLYLADSFRVWRIDPSGTITTVVGLLSSTYPYTPVAGYAGDGGPGLGAGLRGANALEFDSAGNLYISDTGDGCVRKVTARVVGGTPQPLNGTEIVTTFAGTCTQTSSILNSPYGLAFDPGSPGVRDQALYIADPGNANVRKVDMSTGIVTTVAGAFTTPVGVAVDPDTGALYVADIGGGATHAPGQIFRVDPSGTVTSIAAPPAVTTPARVRFGNNGILYALDIGAGKVWQIANAGLTAQTINPIAGLTFKTGQDIALDGAGGLFVTDSGKGEAYFAAGQAEAGSALGQSFSPGSVIVVAGPSSVPTFEGDGGPAIQARLLSPNDMAVDAAGNLYISDSGNSRIRFVNAATGTISTIAGNGVSGFAGVPGPAASASIAPSPILYRAGSGLFFNNGSTRVLNDNNGNLTVVNWTSGIPGVASIAFDVAGNLYVGDTASAALWKVDPSGNATKLATGVSPAKGIGVDPSGNLYIAKASTHQIQKVTPAGVVSIYAGNGIAGGTGDGGPALLAELQAPSGMVCDSVGNLYFTDGSNHTVRKIDTNGIITTIGGTPGVGGYSGDGGAALGAQLEGGNLVFDAWGNLYLSDIFNQVIRVLDDTLPVVTPTATTGGATPYSANTWTNQTVTVQFTCSDTGSGVATCPSNQVFSADGVYQATGVSTDRAGNSGTGIFAGIEIDKTAPTVTASATKSDGTAYVAGTWTNQTVTVSFTCSDAGSGVATCPSNVVLSAEGVTPAVTATASDKAGNTVNSVFGPVWIDKTPPTLNPSVNPNPVALNAAATAIAGAADALSGVASQSCGSVATGALGVFSVACTVTDKAGNTNSATTNYLVSTNGDVTIQAGQSFNFVSQRISGNLTIAGGTVTLNSSTVVGNLQVSGGSFSLTGNSVVQGNVQVTGGGSFSIGPTRIGGSLQVQSLPAATAVNTICGAAVNGDLQVQNNAAAIQIGVAGCAGNSVGGNLVVQNNGAAEQIYGNTVGNNLQVQNNASNTSVFQNVVKSNLQCNGNNAALFTGGGNQAAQKQGQCATF